MEKERYSNRNKKEKINISWQGKINSTKYNKTNMKTKMGGNQKHPQILL